MSEAEEANYTCDVVIDVDADVTAAESSTCSTCPTHLAGLSHEILTSETYLKMLLYNSYQDSPRAKDHARYQMVCKAWAAFESDEWTNAFAPKFGYQWYYGMKQALPSIVAQMVDQKSSQDERASRVTSSEILGVETGTFVVLALTAWWLCCVAGLIMIANYEDQGQLEDVSLYVVAIPFMMGPLIVFVLLYNFARRSWALYSAKKHPRKDQRRLKQHLETAVGGDLKLTTNALKQLERTTSATPDDAKDFFVTKHQMSSTGEAYTAGEFRGVSSGAGSSAVQEATTAMVMVDITGVDVDTPVLPYSKYCEDNIWGPLLAFTTLSMPCVTAMLFAAGASATVAFIPLMVASCVPIVVIFGAMINDGVNCKDLAILGTLYSSIFGTLLACFVLYPLLLDGRIPHTSAADWATALIPAWVLLFCMTICLPCFGTIYWINELRGASWIAREIGWCFFVLVLTGGWLMLACFHFGLVALLLKATGEWDVMSYTTIVSVIGGSTVLFGLAAFLFVRKRED